MRVCTSACCRQHLNHSTWSTVILLAYMHRRIRTFSSSACCVGHILRATSCLSFHISKIQTCMVNDMHKLSHAQPHACQGPSLSHVIVTPNDWWLICLHACTLGVVRECRAMCRCYWHMYACSLALAHAGTNELGADTSSHNVTHLQFLHQPATVVFFLPQPLKC